MRLVMRAPDRDCRNRVICRNRVKLQTVTLQAVNFFAGGEITDGGVAIGDFANSDVASRAAVLPCSLIYSSTLR